MELAKSEAEKIVTQLKQAHRIVVAFYRRMLPLFDETATNLGLQFYYWETLETASPPRKSTQPGSKWAWDFVPLYASRHVYMRSNSEKRVRKGDVGVCFWLYVEDSFASENRREGGQPDPVEMPAGRAIVRAYVYRPREEYKGSFNSWWSEEDTLEVEDGQKWHSVSDFAEGIAFEWPLADVIVDTKLMARTLSNHIGTER